MKANYMKMSTMHWHHQHHHYHILVYCLHADILP